MLPSRRGLVNFAHRAAVPPMEADDLSLVSKAQAGDAAAFRALVVRYQRKVYALALGIVKDADLAWDVAQEAFVRVHGHLAEFEGKSSFSTWVYRIATHLSIDAVRRERRSQKDEMDDVNEAHLAEGGEGILSTALGNDPRENVLRRELAGKIHEALAAPPGEAPDDPGPARGRGAVVRGAGGAARDPQGHRHEPALPRAQEDAVGAAPVRGARGGAGGRVPPHRRRRGRAMKDCVRFAPMIGAREGELPPARRAPSPRTSRPARRAGRSPRTSPRRRTSSPSRCSRARTRATSRPSPTR